MYDAEPRGGLLGVKSVHGTFYAENNCVCMCVLGVHCADELLQCTNVHQANLCLILFAD